MQKNISSNPKFYFVLLLSFTGVNKMIVLLRKVLDSRLHTKVKMY